MNPSQPVLNIITAIIALILLACCAYLIWGKPGKGTPAAPKVTKADRPELTLTRAQELIKVVLQYIHGLEHLCRDHKVKIKPVRVDAKFSGWGFVDGRTEAIKVNRKLHFFESDDDMDFTKYCVLVEGTPTLNLYTGPRGDLMVQYISHEEQDPIVTLLGGSWIDIHTASAFMVLADPVKRILIDLFEFVERERLKALANDPIEKVLHY